MRKWLIALRNEKNMAAQEVAAAIDVSPAYYSLIENGKRQNPMDITLAAKLAVVLGVTLDEIVAHESK